MQQRPYPEDDGQRVWLSRQDQQRLLDYFADDQPRRRLAVQLGLHGLRTDEVVSVAPGDFRTLDGGDQVLIVRDGKTGKREVPVANSLPQRAGMMKSAARLTQDDSLVDVAKRTVRDWIQDAREDLADDLDDNRWLALGMHDLRRTFATDAYYSLAFAGIPIAEQLTMSWGGWAMTDSGRETFRQNYLGPVPDHITADAAEHLSLVE